LKNSYKDEFATECGISHEANWNTFSFRVIDERKKKEKQTIILFSLNNQSNFFPSAHKRLIQHACVYCDA
jgi:hypothetical protein